MKLAICISLIQVVALSSFALEGFRSSRRCVEQLEQNSNVSVTYKFVRNQITDSYSLVVIPSVVSEKNQIKYYNSRGFSEVNMDSLNCASDKTKTDAINTMDHKIVELYKERLENLAGDSKKMADLKADCSEIRALSEYIKSNVTYTTLPSESVKKVPTKAGTSQ